MMHINSIIRWSDGKAERLLWTDGIAGYFINIYSGRESGLPILKKISSIESAIKENQALVLNNDPTFVAIDEELIPIKYREMRDKAWEIIKPLVSEENEPMIYERNLRGGLVQNVAKHNNTTAMTVYKYLRKYWQMGKTINALLPEYFNSGGKGKTKSAGEKKRGRPRKFRDALGEGVNVTDQDIEKFKSALDKYYYVSNGYMPEEVYQLMLSDFYSVDFRYNENGIKLPILEEMNNVPSLRQFLYWFEEKLDIERSLRSRKGNRNFELNERPILNSSANEGLWATYKYQIDATIGDIYLRSFYRPSEIIGRPVIYFVIDVFSRMVVGYYIGLEGPSWLGMSMALANAMMDKVPFCAKYGKEITQEDWPCHFVPEAIMCDRGEGEGKAIETACQSLNIRIENAAPYRADWKGIVERHFRTTNDLVKRRLPGAVLPDFNTRTGRDYRLDATLDLYYFNKLIIELILAHNNEKYMKHYDRNNEVIAEGIKPIPRDLWNWSIAKCRPKVFDEQHIMLSLMPRDTAMVTNRGIKFKKMFYSCDQAIREEWYLKARIKGCWKVDISYDPRNMNNIYIWEIGSSEFEVCKLLQFQKKYFNHDLNEMEYLFDLIEYERTEFEQETRESKSDLNATIEYIIQEAKSKVPNTQKSKAAQIKDIRANRKREKERNRENEGFLLASEESHDGQKNENNSSGMANMTRMGKDKEEDYSFPKRTELLKRKLKERKDGDKGKG